MSTFRTYATCAALGLLLRVLAIELDVVQWLGNRIEVSTPLTNWNRRKEALALIEQNVSPYDGDTVHETPLVILLFQAFSNYAPFSTAYLFLLIDFAIAMALVEIAKIHQKILLETQKREAPFYAKGVDRILISQDELLPIKLAALYALSPCALLTCVGQSGSLFNSASIVFAFLFILKGKSGFAAGFLALATYLSLYPVMLIAPLILIDYQIMKCSYAKSAIRVILPFIVVFAFLNFTSYYISGSWDYVQSVYGFILAVTDLTPNVGLFWYFFMEMFDHFYSFFVWVFQINVFLYTMPLAIRLRKHPGFLFYTLCSVMSIFKSYPTVGDLALPLALLPLWSHTFKYMRYSFLAGSMFLVAVVIGPIFWHMWIYAGNANANFFFASTVVYSLAQILLLNDTVFALLRRDYDVREGLDIPEVDGRPGLVKMT